RGAVDELAVGAAGREVALEHELVFYTRLQTVRFQKGPQRRLQTRHVKHGFDGTTVAAAANQRAVGPFSQHEIERADQDGFARAGLTGDDVVTGLEFQHQI